MGMKRSLSNADIYARKKLNNKNKTKHKNKNKNKSKNKNGKPYFSRSHSASLSSLNNNKKAHRPRNLLYSIIQNNK